VGFGTFRPRSGARHQPAPQPSPAELGPEMSHTAYRTSLISVRRHIDEGGAVLLRVLAGAATAWSVVYLVVYLWVIDPQEGEIAMRGDRSAVGRRLRPRRLRDASAAPGRRVAGGVAA